MIQRKTRIINICRSCMTLHTYFVRLRFAPIKELIQQSGRKTLFIVGGASGSHDATACFWTTRKERKKACLCRVGPEGWERWKQQDN